MARERPSLGAAINEILARHGTDGKRMSFRQAERRTGLSPATIGELAKGNARTPETLRRFARGLGEDVNRLLLLGGFVPDEIDRAEAAPTSVPDEMPDDEGEWLGRLGRALAKMPPGRERELFKESLRRDTELIEAFLERLSRTEPGRRAGHDGRTATAESEE